MWNRIAGVLKTQGAGSKIMGYFYKAIVQAVLLYGSESWTLSLCVGVWPITPTNIVNA
jgi:hypothetical protein